MKEVSRCLQHSRCLEVVKLLPSTPLGNLLMVFAQQVPPGCSFWGVGLPFRVSRLASNKNIAKCSQPHQESSKPLALKPEPQFLHHRKVGVPPTPPLQGKDGRCPTASGYAPSSWHRSKLQDGTVPDGRRLSECP